MIWKTWKKAFNTWEEHTADYLETVLKNPMVLKPSGKLLSLAMKAKAKRDEAVNKWWATMGLPTKHDQERTLHNLNQLESRSLDLEQKLEEQRHDD